MNNNELYHYGVKGMHWGVRHDPERASRDIQNYKTAKAQYKADKRAALDRMKSTGQRLTRQGKENDMGEVNKMTSRYKSDIKKAKAKRNAAKAKARDFRAFNSGKEAIQWSLYNPSGANVYTQTVRSAAAEKGIINKAKAATDAYLNTPYRWLAFDVESRKFGTKNMTMKKSITGRY